MSPVLKEANVAENTKGKLEVPGRNIPIANAGLNVALVLFGVQISHGTPLNTLFPLNDNRLNRFILNAG